MNQGAPEGLTWLFGMVGLIYMLRNTSNPIGYIALVFSSWMIYRLLKKEEQHEITERQ